jgi:hypothetical protein
MCGARPDGRGVGVTETPLNDLPATSVMDAELRKCGHCFWCDALMIRSLSVFLTRRRSWTDVMLLVHLSSDFWGCSGFSRPVCSLINCKFAGVLPEHSIWAFAAEIFARALKGVLICVSLRLTALVRLWCCVYSPEKPGDRPRSSVERTF